MSDKQNLEAEVISKAEHEALMSEFRKENLRLQKLIAKNQVEYESELNRIIAIKDEEIAKAKAANPSLIIQMATTENVQNNPPK